MRRIPERDTGSDDGDGAGTRGRQRESRRGSGGYPSAIARVVTGKWRDTGSPASPPSGKSWTMLTEVTFEAFRAFKKVTIPLKPLTVFVGPNGSGKTSVLLGIHAVLRCLREHHSTVFSNELSLPRIRNIRAGRHCMLVAGTGTPGAQSFGVKVVDDVFVPISDGIQIPGLLFDHLASLHPLGNSAFLRLDSRALSRASYSEREVPLMSDDGTGLASVIADLLSRAPAHVDTILESLQKVVPSVRKIRVARAKVTNSFTDHFSMNGAQIPVQRSQDFWGHRVILDTASGDDIPLDACSEGTVLALGIMTVLHGEEAPRTLLIDEIDRSLHPKAQLALVDVLRAAQKADSNLQILATGHSPFLLNALDYDEVRVTTLDDEGGALCASLADHPDLAEWKDSLKPGDWWSSELEDWVKEQAKR